MGFYRYKMIENAKKQTKLPLYKKRGKDYNQHKRIWRKEKPAMTLRFRKWDIAAVAAVVLLAGLVFLLFLPGPEQTAAAAHIYQDGKLIKTVSLEEDQQFAITGRYSCTVTVRGGKIAVTGSDCPGEDCVRSGWISGPGRSIVCLPGGVEIRVVSGSADVDFVVG